MIVDLVKESSYSADINPAMPNPRTSPRTVGPVLLLALTCMFTMLSPPSQAGAANLARLTAPPHLCKGQSSRNAKPKRQVNAMRCLINFARARSGLRKLRPSQQLDRSARRKSQDMIRCGSFDHSACGRDFTYWMHRVGYTGRCWSGGENIAWGQNRLGNARQIFRAWMRSSGHRANILSRNFNALGIGMRKARFQGRPGAQVWTTHFGKRC